MIKIEKRKTIRWFEQIAIPVIPIIMYGSGKLMGKEYNELEFIWWIYISLACVIYFLIQFKVQKKHN